MIDDFSGEETARRRDQQEHGFPPSGASRSNETQYGQ
jgi:hypothetical protein